MIVHELKIWPKFYRRVADGSKTFEVRNNDRDYQRGDGVILNEWDPEKKLPTDSPVLKFTIGYVLLAGDDAVFSLLPWREKQ